MTDAWMVAVSNTNCERRATQGLEAAGFEVWWPTRLVEVRVGPKRAKILREFPLFPGYLFVRQLAADGWQAMIGIDGVRTVLVNDQRPMTISEDLMRAVRRDATLIATADPSEVFNVGDEVVIMAGPCAGLRTSVTRILGLAAVEVALGGLRASVGLQSLERV